MKENYWQHFCVTGSIRDYLDYRAQSDESLKQVMERHGIYQMKKEDTALDAGIYRSNGIGDTEPSDGRI